MARVVIVGAGLYGLIAAKTYLQVVGAYESDTENGKDYIAEIPACFTATEESPAKDATDRLLVIDSASDIGGTWAEERLYPNLLSQNSYGLYEFSDLALLDVVPEQNNGDGTKDQFIAGWKINRYLRALTLNYSVSNEAQVDDISRLENKQWKLNITKITPNSTQRFTIFCDKLILATGLTSMPNLPDTKVSSDIDSQAPVIHAKDVGSWAREHLGYQPLGNPQPSLSSLPSKEPTYAELKSVSIYGGAKSSFDLVHFFATLHRNDQKLRLASTQNNPIQVHWVIRDRGAGPSWMVPPTSTLPNGDTVASDKAASTRLLSHLTPCWYKIPKRFSFKEFRWEGAWLTRLFHGNPLGRWWIRIFWKSVDNTLEETAQYGSDPKMEKIRPENSVVSCACGIGIANQGDLWEAIRLPHVHVYRAAVSSIGVPGSQETTDSVVKAVVQLSDGTSIDDVDLVVHATGYKPIVPIQFYPPSLRLNLGLSALVDSEPQDYREDQALSTSPEIIHGSLGASLKESIEHWDEIDRHSELKVRNTLNATKCILADRRPPSWTASHKLLPYRLFRRMVAPELVSQGDRSFATLGVLLSSTIAVVAEVQALWVAAFLTGALDSSSDTGSANSQALCFPTLSDKSMENSISEDVVFGSLTGSGLGVDAILYNDMLMRDLGLNPYRLGGGVYTELTGVYKPSAYAGIVHEWKKSRGLTGGSA
ncbi:hypothetical protein PENANT_c011G07056 [Penicillium antarcticum]|uniref:FAD/NAD(P)-binding domain-containing protein n=1 Tax=Penicillium antarcticum TaxID=416450 RepID=A0A1V6Q6S8_9EURO|nr:hypothetical protein PENANT_c011G07056 [Penicillium antarcticum]